MDHDQQTDTTEVDHKDGLLPLVICYRDPVDVRTIRRQSRLLLLALFVTATAVVGVVYKCIQRPDRIVVDRSSGRTVMINDRELGATEAVRLEKDKLQIADMDYVVRTYVDYLYRVDQRSRAKDIEAALRLMVPGQAKKFAQYLTEQKVLQTQREQQWNAAWKIEYLEHAPGKPFVSSLKTRPLKTRGVRATMTPGGLNAEEQIQRTPDHRDPESSGSRTDR